MEQISFSGESFETQLTAEFIVSHKELVVDFFGDNRTTWYSKLLQGGSRFLKTSLDSQEAYDEDSHGDMDADLPPLDPSRVTDERARNIESFFQEYADARIAFQEYARNVA